MSYRHNFLFFLGGGGWRGAGELTFYFKGTLENNSLFLGNKINVKECLKIILRNKADQRHSRAALTTRPRRQINLYTVMHNM